MRTIIINTLGSELRHNPLFYMPFREDRMHWIEKSLKSIKGCVQEISAYQSEQGKIQDYHVVILVSLTKFRDTELKNIRQTYEDLLFAYLNQYLLQPLCQQQIPPAAASVVYVIEKLRDGEGHVELEREYDHIFGFTPDMQEMPSLQIVTEDGDITLDLSELFGDVLTSYRESFTNQHRYDATIQDNHALEILRRKLRDQTASWQTCTYTPVGLAETVQLPVQKVDYCPRTTDWDMFSVDMQINLSEHLATTGDSTQWKLNLEPHEPAEICKRLTRAVCRVNYLKEEAPKVGYYPLQVPPMTDVRQDIQTEIWGKLREGDALPGVQEAFDYQKSGQTSEKKTGFVKAIWHKLRDAWVRVLHAKKQFEVLYRSLQDQYAPKQAEKEQSAILNVCAKVFGDWRRQVLSRKPQHRQDATEEQLPTFDAALYENELAQAQQEWGAASAQQLADYTDLRQEAEEIRADFNKAFRLWPEGSLNPTGKFCIYSIVLAVIFLVQMMVPYIGITMSQEGVELSRYVHFLLSLAMFTGLYLVGVFFWLNALGKQLQGYNHKLYVLIRRSGERRRDSIVHAVELYGRVLPKCTLCHEKLEYLRRIHETNLQRKERYNTHMQQLDKASELLTELLTLLRLPVNVDSKEIKAKGQIDYQYPPSAPVNVPYYTFMSDKWGG